jgi:hypothetical protein
LETQEAVGQDAKQDGRGHMHERVGPAPRNRIVFEQNIKSGAGFDRPRDYGQSLAVL